MGIRELFLGVFLKIYQGSGATPREMLMQPLNWCVEHQVVQKKTVSYCLESVGTITPRRFTYWSMKNANPSGGGEFLFLLFFPYTYKLQNGDLSSYPARRIPSSFRLLVLQERRRLGNRGLVFVSNFKYDGRDVITYCYYVCRIQP